MAQRPYKDLSELTMMDDYMFGVVMQDPAIAKMVIECILRVRIKRLEYVEPQKNVNERYDAKSVRLDLYGNYSPYRKAYFRGGIGGAESL